jgi:hypothetical protein
MEQIGILGEFFHAGNEYALRHYSETDYLDDEVIHFDNKTQLRAYLSNLQKDPTTWTVLNTVARNFGLDACRTTIDRCDREDLDFLCDKILSEEWVLIIRRYHGMKSVKLEPCCIELTQKINRAITSSAITSAILIALPFFQAFFILILKKLRVWRRRQWALEPKIGNNWRRRLRASILLLAKALVTTPESTL